jgi:CheY-like chemotaxis protein
MMTKMTGCRFNAPLRRSLSVSFPDFKIDLHFVNDGVELFLEYLEKSIVNEGDTPCPSVILLDLNMPRMSGD